MTSFRPSIGETPAAAPAVTVLMSCYNGACWLGEAIESVLSQTFADFEFLIVDDGSTDDSPAILADYAQRDRRIRIVTKTNSGLANSLNAGLKVATGEWIARIDSDDVCEPDRLEKQMAVVRAGNDAVFFGSGFWFIDEAGQKYARYTFPSCLGFGGGARMRRYLLRGRRFPAHSSALFHRETVLALGGYRQRIKRAEDYDLWLRLAEVKRLNALELPLVSIRKHPGQVSMDASGRRQRFDAYVALSGYWVRKAGGPDPIAADDATFLSYQEFVAKRCDEERVFEYYEFLEEVKQGIRRSRGFGILRLSLRLAINYDFFLRYVLSSVADEPTSKRIAKAWIERTK